MISKITGTLLAVSETDLTVSIDAFEYQVRIPEFVRHQLQRSVGQEISLHTIQYLDGNPNQGRLVPRLVGFSNEAEREFFELFCSVDGMGVTKALRAMIRPVEEVAVTIERQDIKGLSALPGIGPGHGGTDCCQATPQGAEICPASDPRTGRRYSNRTGPDQRSL